MKESKKIIATIELDSNFKIEVDKYNWVLRYESEPTTKLVRGKMKDDVVSKDHWYYPTLKSCLTSYMDKHCRDSNSVSEILQKLEEVEQRIENICNHESLHKLTSHF